jgi:hypothetical protein
MTTASTRWPPRRICQYCKPGKNFFTHSENAGAKVALCSEVVSERTIDGVRCIALCACTVVAPHAGVDASGQHPQRRRA